MCTPCTLDEKHKSIMAHHTATQSQKEEEQDEQEQKKQEQKELDLKVQEEQEQNKQEQKEQKQKEQEQIESEKNKLEELQRKEQEHKEEKKNFDLVMNPTETMRSKCDGWNYGLIIGNSEYACTGLSDLPTIKADRKFIFDKLGNRETFNIDFTNSEHPSQIDEYTNVEDIIGQVQMFMEEVEEKVTQARGRGGEADTFLMFFFGHGGNVKGIDCVLGVNGKPYSVKSILHKILDKSIARKVIMILDCCRNKLDSDRFKLLDEEIKNLQLLTDFTKVIRIWSTEETHEAPARSRATFSEALCEVLEKNTKGVKMANLEQILNEHWWQKQKNHPMMGKVVYTCKVDPTRDYESMFLCI